MGDFIELIFKIDETTTKLTKFDFLVAFISWELGNICIVMV